MAPTHRAHLVLETPRRLENVDVMPEFVTVEGHLPSIPLPGVPHLLIKLPASDQFRENVDPLLSPYLDVNQVTKTMHGRMDALIAKMCHCLTPLY